MSKRISILTIAPRAAAIALAVAAAAAAHAFDTSVYTSTSRLASERLMKISVETDGLYLIPTSTLRSWGFTDISRVAVYGYGGRRQSDILSHTTYVDDLPRVQTAVTDRGIVFYGVGAGEWLPSGSGYYYQTNDYDTHGHYFVGLAQDGEEARAIPAADCQPTSGATAATTFMERRHHEQELLPVTGEAGPLVVGEDFRFTNTRNFTFDAPGATRDAQMWLQCSFISTTTTTGSSLSFKVNGADLPTVPSDAITALTSTRYTHAVETVAQHSFTASATDRDNLLVTLTLNMRGNVSNANLNYLSLNYERELRMPSSGSLVFTTDDAALALEGASQAMVLWDVTDPLNITAVGTGISGTAARWTYPSAATRTFAAWTPSATLAAPKAVGWTATQNLHEPSEVDMVIVAPSAFEAQAQRLADMHASTDIPLKVTVVNPEHIYNEFSSGTVDPGAFRRYFKMLYDRGNESGRPLRYAILMGRTTLDNRGITSRAPSYPTLPSWMPRAARSSLSDNEGYCSDDIMAMLEDGSGSNLRTDNLSIALGRIPVTSVNEARDVVDKERQYVLSPRKDSWRHRFMFLADDQDNGIHMEQTEKLLDNLLASDSQQHLIRKVYTDAYTLEGGVYTGAKAVMNKYLDEGVVWWNFIGHASPVGWTGEGMLTYNDLNQLYLRHWPFIYAATCDFLRLDGTTISGGEILYKERYGGAIGIISAVRPVYIAENEYLSNAMGRALGSRDADGRVLTTGEMYRQAKNDLRDKNGKPVADDNRLRFIFIGDPALRLGMPSNVVRLDSIGDMAVDADNQPVMAALERVPVSGTVTSPSGEPLTDFNGTVTVEIYDAERSVTTLGNGKDGKEVTFDEYGDRIYCGSARVENGRFSLTVAMPMELTQNFRPATMSLYAYADNSNAEAVGLNRDFYVYGFDENAEPDDNAPEIRTMFLNHSSFTDGTTVNTSPMLIAEVGDDVGLNMSTAGIGHQMTAILDGKETFTDVSMYFTPSPDGTPSGTINYPFDNIRPGNHTLTLRIWDTAGNSTSRSVEFFAAESLAPKIYDIYSDANPASTQANFYLSHDQPDGMVTVTVTVYTLAGRPIWSDSASGRSDMFLSVPVTWDLTSGGTRVGRGIYLYRATITADGQTYETASRRIAVTAQ